MEDALHIDFETRSELNLKDVGLHRYARHPSTEPWCLGWALNDGDPTIFKLPFTTVMKDSPVLQHVAAGLPVYAHNAPFELEIWNQIMVPRYGWPVLRPEQTFCTMAMCYAMALPGGLENAISALGLPDNKDPIGHVIMVKFAHPWKRDPVVWADKCPSFTVGGVKWTGKEGLARLYDYCMQDVLAERAMHKKLYALSASERKVWLLDHRINNRGVAVDLESAKGAVQLAEKLKEQYNVAISEATKGEVQTCTALGPIKQYLADHGLPAALVGLAKQAVADFLAQDDLSIEARRVLELRSEAGKASAAKFDAIVERACDDGRVRGMYQYHGAGPGRWTGRGVQTHNLVRDMPPASAVETILGYVKEGAHEKIEMIYGSALSTLTRCLRSFFVAPEGKALIAGDWSNVEGRGQAWFAGEQWKLDAFVAADNKTGPGLYELAYSRMFGVPVESVKNPSHERQIGKVSELAFGYQGGVGSFHSMAKNYGVKVSDADADTFKNAWRDAHPKIAGVYPTPEATYREGGIWSEIETAAICAVKTPGVLYKCGLPGREASFKKVGEFLWCKLPSGRVICYPFPKILSRTYREQLTYMSKPDPNKPAKIIEDKQNSAVWARVSTYGGSLFNNIVQGFCRDILAGAMLDADDTLPVVLHTHDEVVSEVPILIAKDSAAELQRIMRTTPAWAKGFPLHADCKVMQRYGK